MECHQLRKHLGSNKWQRQNFLKVPHHHHFRRQNQASSLRSSAFSVAYASDSFPHLPLPLSSYFSPLPFHSLSCFLPAFFSPSPPVPALIVSVNLFHVNKGGCFIQGTSWSEITMVPLSSPVTDSGLKNSTSSSQCHMEVCRGLLGKVS